VDAEVVASLQPLQHRIRDCANAGLQSRAVGDEGQPGIGVHGQQLKGAFLIGQVRGVEKMLDEGRDCREILRQLAAIKSAVQQASLTIARSYACQCLATADDGKSQEQIVDELLSVLSKT